MPDSLDSVERLCMLSVRKLLKLDSCGLKISRVDEAVGDYLEVDGVWVQQQRRQKQNKKWRKICNVCLVPSVYTKQTERESGRQAGSQEGGQTATASFFN